MTLKLPDTGANTLPDGRRLTPSAERNTAAILETLRGLNLHGPLLEIASGSGYHAAQMAPALPNLIWQPTDISANNLTSITAWAAQIPNIRPPQILDATRPGWHASYPGQNAILLVNLLHLIPQTAAATLLGEAARALAPGGTALFYGPFLRAGETTSPGDAAFHASLQAQDPSLGYKDVVWVLAELARAGLTTTTQTMPANNLSLIARKP